MTEPQPLRALLVEDNPSDVVIFREAIATAGLAVEVEVAWNGQEALDRLRNPGAADARPDVVILDVNLPILSGREMLTQMGADDRLSAIPVVILTGSKFENECRAAYREDRCIFVVKPFDFPALVEVARRIVAFAAPFRDAAQDPARGGDAQPGA